jgi:DNA-binding response OmpR family regulator
MTDARPVAGAEQAGSGLPRLGETPWAGSPRRGGDIVRTGQVVGTMASAAEGWRGVMSEAPTLTPHVLVLDDDPSVRQLVCDYLRDNELRATAVASGKEFDAALARETIDLVVLDLRLPGEDGLQIARRLRETSSLPILMLTGRAEEADRVMGLELGADDYLTKPFSTRELLARIRALLRRARAQATVADAIARVRAYRFGSWELNIGLRRLKAADGRSVELTNGEFSLLAAFVSSPQRVLSRDQLLDLSRLHNAEVYDRSIDVQILRLRRKIERDPARPQFIKTERGAGYLFDAVVEAVH